MVTNPKARKKLKALRKDTEKWFKEMDKMMDKGKKSFNICGYCGRDKPVCYCGGRGITLKQYKQYLAKKKKLKKVM